MPLLGSSSASESELSDDKTVVFAGARFGAVLFCLDPPATVADAFPLSAFFAGALFCTPLVLAIVPLDGASPDGLGGLNGALCWAEELDAVREGAIEIVGRSLK